MHVSNISSYVYIYIHTYSRCILYIYIYIIEKYTWKIPVAAIHIEGKQYLQGHAGTKYVANGFPEHGVGFTVWSHLFIFLAINVLPKYALCRYRTQTSKTWSKKLI